jgi:hypothetical protein
MKHLTRNTLLALPLAFAIAAALPGGFDLLDGFIIAFFFTYGGHWVEVLLLKIPGIETGGGKLVRVVGWFAGGLWCYVLARWVLVASGRDTSLLPSLVWGGLFFVALEFLVHALLQAAGKPNFYSGQVTESESTAAR